MPSCYELLVAEGIGYTIRTPAHRVLQPRNRYLLKRSTAKRGARLLRRLQSSGAELEENGTCGGQGRAAFERLRPRVGFVVTNLARPAEGSVAFYNQRGRQIKEGKRRD